MTTAADIAKWAWEDPESRVQDALSQVRELAATATTARDLADAQDAGVMLSRLASSLEPGTITAQLTAGTIIGQLIDLSRRDAWRTEHRGPHGEWEGSGGGGVGRAEANRALRQARRARLEKAQADQESRMHEIAKQESGAAAAKPASRGLLPKPAITLETEAEDRARLAAMPLLPGETMSQHMNPLPGETMHENLVHEEVVHQVVHPRIENKAQQIMADTQKKLKAQYDLIAHQQDTEAGKAARKKAITEASIGVGLGALGLVAIGLGAPAIVAVLGQLVATLIQVAIEHKYRL